MSSTTEQALHRTMAATFEELGLVVPDLEPSAEQSAVRMDFAASVSFRGPISGRLVLRASRTVLSELAENMLGSDNMRDELMHQDALGEVANVICGNFLPQVAGANAIFVLSAPQWQDEIASNSDNSSVKASAALGVGQGRAVTELVLFGDLSSTAEFNAIAA
ncbi:MAG: chemotaxis protein CheX [Gemmatimonadaceae bacterium]